DCADAAWDARRVAAGGQRVARWTALRPWTPRPAGDAAAGDWPRLTPHAWLRPGAVAGEWLAAGALRRRGPGRAAQHRSVVARGLVGRDALSAARGVQPCTVGRLVRSCLPGRPVRAARAGLQMLGAPGAQALVRDEVVVHRRLAVVAEVQ